MDITFHYYTTFILALTAGFNKEEAYKIAYSCQYVDDNTKSYTIYNRNRTLYNNIITQTFNPLLSEEEILNIYPVFHFLPGNYNSASKKRKDGQIDIMCTTPNNKLAKLVLRNALKEGDLYHIGVASHAFEDTWAHQNFSGTFNECNAVYSDIYNNFNNTSSDEISRYNHISFYHIGHLDILDVPDQFGKVWNDYRLKNCRICNNTRFLDAAKHLLIEYSAFFCKKDNEETLKNTWTKLGRKLKKALKQGQNHINNLCVLCEKEFGITIPEYDSKEWERNAFYINRWHKNYTSSSWYLFQEASKCYFNFINPFILKRRIMRSSIRQ